ncbi:uncharacterized protein B0H64DRAFT_244020 [Chaetomium fimeti]|uniref:Uncharacterized protein n=1 Tax=Chaetomium fimeti TaxID=1854472 RepID=A0AAE0H963_9PEZI|nr:hypothetical protein B0H64DRAFT_244020 [Chaetomium fimeti]
MASRRDLDGRREWFWSRDGRQLFLFPESNRRRYNRIAGHPFAWLNFSRPQLGSPVLLHAIAWLAGWFVSRSSSSSPHGLAQLCTIKPFRCRLEGWLVLLVVVRNPSCVVKVSWVESRGSYTKHATKYWKRKREKTGRKMGRGRCTGCDGAYLTGF